MTIAFNNIPSSLRVPLFYAEVNPGGTPFSSSERLILIGHKTAAGAAALDTPTLVATSPSQEEDRLFGSGSMLASMVKAARLNAPVQEIWAMAIAEPAGAAATGTLDLTPLTLPATQTSLVTTYIAGREYNITVSTVDTAATLATSLAAAINADVDGPVTAADAAGVVTLTARHTGTYGNDIDLRGSRFGDETTFSSEVAITAMAGGVGDPDVTPGLAAMGDEDFTWIASAFSDAANLDVFETFMSDVSGRWSPISQLYGHVLTVRADTVANLSTLGLTRNDAHTTIMGVTNPISSPYDIVAALGGQVGRRLSDAPNVSRPMQFIALEGIVPPAITDRHSVTDRNTLYFDGIGGFSVNKTGDLLIDRILTTYRVNAAGFADATFLDLNTMAQSQFLLRYMRTSVTNDHSDKALANDSAVPNSFVSRPRDIRNTIIGAYAELANLGVVENQEAFESGLIVERNAIDANRVDVLLPVDVVNQLRVLAVRADISLQL